MNSAPRRLAGFDGLRALAALGIVVFHVASHTGATQSTWLGDYLARLDAAVAVFFVISAYLLYRPFVAADLGRRGAVSVPRFWARPCAPRIYPAYWLALTATIGVFRNDELSGLWDYVRHYLLVQSYQEGWGLAGIVPAWTLAVEVAFYAVLPLYAWVLRRLTVGRSLGRQVTIELASTVVVYAIGFGSRIVIADARGTDSPWLHVLLPLLDWFAIGLVLSVVATATASGWRPRWVESLVHAADRFPGRCWAGAALAFVLVANIGLPRDGLAGTMREDVLRQFLYGAFVLLLVVPVAWHERGAGPVRRFLDARVMVALGTISYGIFLWHFDWIEQLRDWGAFDWVPSLRTPFVLVMTLALTIATATLSWVLVERPLLRRRRSATPRDTAGIEGAPA